MKTALKIKHYLIAACIVLFPIADTIGCYYLYNFTKTDTVKLSMLVLFCSFGSMITYLIKTSKDTTAKYDNPLPLFCSIALISILVPFFKMLPKEGLPFLGLFCAVYFFSCFETSLMISLTYLGLAVFICDFHFVSFYAYLVPFLIAICIFKAFKMTDDFGFKVIIVLLIQFGFEAVGFLFLDDKITQIEPYFILLINAFLNFIIIMLSMFIYKSSIENLNIKKYSKLNDKEYVEMSILQDESKEEYLRSIHTAYLVGQICDNIECNKELAVNLAYYHRIKKAFNYSQSQCEKLFDEHNFPIEAKRALLSYFDKKIPLTSKEAGIVYLSDKLIAYLQAIFKQSNTVKLDYNELVETLFKKKFVCEEISDSDLSQKDIKIIKNSMIKEATYYDIIR